MGRFPRSEGRLFEGPSDLARAREAMALAGVLELGDHSVDTLAGGERQRALLARALAQEPRFIVLDEPTASLDFGNQGKVMHEIRALSESGLGVLFTTHDPNHAMRAATRAFLLRDGACLAEGPVGDMLRRDRLEQLYRAPVQIMREDGRVAFLPG